MKGLHHSSFLYRVFDYEWVVMISVMPLLMFPTIRPRLTALALLFVLILWLARLLVREEAWPVTPFNGVLLLFSLTFLVSVLVTAVPELTLPKATNLLLGLWVFRLLGFQARDERMLIWGWGMLLLLGLGMVGMGILTIHWPRKLPAIAPLLKQLPQMLVSLPEAPKGGVNANQLGGVLAFYVPLVGGALSTVNVKTHKRVWMPLLFILTFLLLVATGVLLLTQSRSGWIGGFGGMAIALALAGWTSSRRPLRVLTTGTVVCALVALLVLVKSTWGQEHVVQSLFVLSHEGVGTTDVGRVNIASRLEIWSRAVYALQDFSFTGIGLGTFRYVTPLLYPYFTITTTVEGPPHAHNIFLQVGVDFGFPGLIAYTALLFLAGWTAWVRSRGGGWARTVSLSIIGAMLGLHLYGITDAIALGAKPGVLFWMALGLLSALTPSDMSPQAPANLLDARERPC